MDRETWRAIVHGVAKSQTQLGDWACSRLLNAGSGCLPVFSQPLLSLVLGAVGGLQCPPSVPQDLAWRNRACKCGAFIPLPQTKWSRPWRVSSPLDHQRGCACENIKVWEGMMGRVCQHAVHPCLGAWLRMPRAVQMSSWEKGCWLGKSDKRYSFLLIVLCISLATYGHDLNSIRTMLFFKFWGLLLKKTLLEYS